MRNSFLLTNNIQTLDFFTLYRSAKLKEGEEEVAKLKLALSKLMMTSLLGKIATYQKHRLSIRHVRIGIM